MSLTNQIQLAIGTIGVTFLIAGGGLLFAHNSLYAVVSSLVSWSFILACWFIECWSSSREL